MWFSSKGFPAMRCMMSAASALDAPVVPDRDQGSFQSLLMEDKLHCAYSAGGALLHPRTPPRAGPCGLPWSRAVDSRRNPGGEAFRFRRGPYQAVWLACFCAWHQSLSGGRRPLGSSIAEGLQRGDFKPLGGIGDPGGSCHFRLLRAPRLSGRETEPSAGPEAKAAPTSQVGFGDHPGGRAPTRIDLCDSLNHRGTRNPRGTPASPEVGPIKTGRFLPLRPGRGRQVGRKAREGSNLPLGAP